MTESDKKLIDFLLQGEFLTEEDLKGIQEAAKQEEKTLEEILVERDVMKEDELGQIVADINDWKFVSLGQESIDHTVLKLIPETVAKNQKVLAFAKTKEGVRVAMSNPDDTTVIHLLQKKLGGPVIPCYATASDILTSISHYQQDIEKRFDELIKAHAKEAVGGDAEDSSVVGIVNLLLSHSYQNHASDIHVEPQEEDTVVRFRIDGVMHDIVTIPKKIHELIITRVKIMSKLRTDEHQIPQDGKLRFLYEDEPVDVRISIVPTTKGENIVMRLLAGKDRQLTLEDLGFSPSDYQKVKKNIKKPWGLILATGPTGSGKTTSLYAILKILNSKDVNVATIEDPVEYNIDGVTQIQVNTKAKLTFSAGLRSIVRQDPDIIMVGEIRDEETAEIAVNSAMTGHLVLSTLHTNDAPTTLPRLLDMNIEPFLVASTINIAIGQRLLRKNCPKCIQSYEMTLEEIQKKFPKSVVEKLAAKGKDKFLFYQGMGCELCQNSGYKGRMGVYEILEMTNEIRELIMANADADAIKAKAIEQGMTTMFDDGLEKVLNGTTTVEELLRVTKS